MVQFRVIQFGMVQFGALYMNLRQPYTFMCQIGGGGGLIFHLSKYGILVGGKKKAVTPVWHISTCSKAKRKLSKFCHCQAYLWFEKLGASP